jgi:predicted aspartyl protease
MSGAVRAFLMLLSLSLISGPGIAVPPWPPPAATIVEQPATAATSTTSSATTTDVEPDNGPRYAIATRRDRIGRIIAPVRIDGQGPFRFMLDTGANHTVLAASLLPQLHLTAHPESPIAVVGVSGSGPAASVRIESLDTGELHFRDLDLPVLSGPVLAGLDGILGMDGLDGLRLSADFLKDRLTISQSRRERGAFPYAVVPVTFLSERLLMVDTYIGRVRTKAIIDTGGLRTIGNRALLAALSRAHQAHELRLHTPVVDAIQASQIGMIAVVPGLQLGSADIGDLPVIFGDFNVFKAWGLEDQPALLVGMDVLGTLSEFIIDYGSRQLLLLTPRERARHMPSLGR